MISNFWYYILELIEIPTVSSCWRKEVIIMLEYAQEGGRCEGESSLTEPEQKWSEATFSMMTFSSPSQFRSVQINGYLSIIHLSLAIQ